MTVKLDRLRRMPKKRIGTVVWFAATQTPKFSSSFSNKASDITVTEYNKSLGEVPIDVLKCSAAFVKANSKTNLALAAYKNGANTVNLTTGYLDSAGKFHEITIPDGYALYGTLTITVQLDSTKIPNDKYTTTSGDNTVTFTKSQIESAIANKTAVPWTITPATDSLARVFETTANGTDNSVTGSVDLSGLTFASGSATFSCLAYVYGGTTGNDVQSVDSIATVNANVGVNVSIAEA